MFLIDPNSCPPYIIGSQFSNVIAQGLTLSIFQLALASRCEGQGKEELELEQTEGRRGTDCTQPCFHVQGFGPSGHLC